jgi:hypothetical protein
MVRREIYEVAGLRLGYLQMPDEFQCPQASKLCAVDAKIIVFVRVRLRGAAPAMHLFFSCFFSSSTFKHSSKYYILKHDFTQTNT